MLTEACTYEKAAMLPVFGVPENADRRPALTKSGNVAAFCT